jgi:sec-independent protein translocase protein TatA
MFDPSAPHIIILLVVVLLLFGSTRLPGAAQALGKSMHIFKRSVKGLDEDKQDTTRASAVSPPQLTSPPPGPGADPSQQAQIDALQRQLSDLQRQSQPSQGTSGAPGDDAAATAQHDTRSH